MTDELMARVHPGEILCEDLMKPLGLTAEELAEALGIETDRVRDIIAGEKPVTGEVALRLARYFGNSPEMWMTLQSDYDLETAKDAMAAAIEKAVQPRRSSMDAASA